MLLFLAISEAVTIGRASSETCLHCDVIAESLSCKGPWRIALSSQVSRFSLKEQVLSTTLPIYWGGVFRVCNFELFTPDLDLFVGTYYESNTTIPQEDTREYAPTEPIISTSSNGLGTSALPTVDSQW